MKRLLIAATLTFVPIVTIVGATSSAFAMDFMENKKCILNTPGRAPVHTTCLVTGGMQGGTLDISIKTPDGQTYPLVGPIDGENGKKFRLQNASAHKSENCYRRNDRT